MTDVSAAAAPRRSLALTTAEGRSLVLLFALPGALAGLVLYVVSDLDLLGLDRWRFFFVTLAVFGTGAWALSTEPGDRKRAALFAASLGIVLGLLSQSAEGRYDDEGLFQALVALPALGWIALAYYRGGTRNYAGLFAAAWNLPVVLAVSLAFAGGAYALLWLLAAMFHLIGLSVLTSALGEEAFSYPIVGALTASGIAVVRRQEAILQSLRTVLFGLLRVLAPVFAFGTALFSLALLFRGLDTLWEGWSPVILLVATLVAGIVFVNAIVQDAEVPGGALEISARVQALVLPILAGLAVYGMAVRIGDHGLTPQRLIASMIAGFAAAYAGAYAVAGATGRWHVLRQGNLILAIALWLAMAFVLTPLFRASEWSTANQIARLERGDVAPEDFDYAALRFDFDEPGRAALADLAEGEGVVAERAAEALASENRYALAAAEREGVGRAAILNDATVRPAGAVVPLALRREVAGRLSQEDEAVEAEHVFLMLPDFDDGRDAALWIRWYPGAVYIAPELWIEAGEDAPAGTREWVYVQRYSREFGSATAAAAAMAHVREGAFGTEAITVVAPSIDGVPLLPDQPNLYVRPHGNR